MKKRSYQKLLGILFSYSLIIWSYPHIRFAGNWINTDFPHIIPGLAYTVNTHEIFGVQVRGHSVFYQTIVLIIEIITNSELSQIILYAIPLFAVISLPAIWFTVSRNYLDLQSERLVYLFLVVIVPHLAVVRLSGKHIVFSIATSFLLLHSVEKVIIVGSYKYTVVGIFMSMALILYHSHISIYIFGIIIFYIGLLLLRKGIRHLDNRSPQFGALMMITAVISWIYYMFKTPNMEFKRFIIGMLPPYPQPAAVQEATGDSIASSGIKQFTSLLTTRWDPWWSWFIANIGLLIVLISGGIIWLYQTYNILSKKRQESDLYLLVTAFGIVFLLGSFYGIKGPGSQNILIRQFRYFVPIAAIIVGVGSKKVLSRKSLIPLILVVLIVSAAVAPIYTSRELLNRPIGTWSSSESEAASWAHEYTQGGKIGTSDQIVASNYQNIIYSEIYDYGAHLFTPDRDVDMRIHSRYYDDIHNSNCPYAEILYSSHKNKISTSSSC